jgi:hypothetical protein
MRRRTMIGAFLLVGLGALLGTTVLRDDIAQATGLAQSVTVNNTAANPVPVQEQNLDGSNIRVHEEGTAGVNVTNTSLAVNGTVGINPNANGVQEVNSVAFRPFSEQESTTFGAGNPGAFNAIVDLFTVPAGERVVITYAAANVDVPTGEHAIVYLTSLSGIPTAYLPLTDAGVFNVAFANEFHVGGGPVNVVYSPGQHIVMNAFRSQGDGDNIGRLQAAVAGFTVPIP